MIEVLIMFSLVMMLAQRGINYNPCNEKVVVCRDIEFDVEGTWDWSFQEEKRQSNIFIEEEQPSNEELQAPAPTSSSSSFST